MGEPRALLDSEEPGARFLTDLVAERLVRLDDKDEQVPRLAEAVPTLENGLARIASDVPEGRLIVTFRLRPALVWQDGAPLTSTDIAFAWSRDRAAPLGSRRRADAELIERVEAPDARTAVAYLRPGVRTARFPLLARALPAHLLLGDPAALSRYAARPTHAGPFALSAWADGEGVSLRAFRSYALGAPGLARIDVRFYADRERLVDGLAAGDLDLVPAGFLGADLIPRLDRFVEARRLVARYTPQQAGELLLFNVRAAPFADRRVRQAVALAIDRKAIVEEVFHGRLRVSGSYLYPPSWAAEEVALPEPDPAAARAWLTAAGYCASARCDDAPSLRARILIADGDSGRSRVATLIARDLGRLGIDAAAVAYPAPELRERLRSGAFDLAIFGRHGDDPSLATADYLTGSASNVSGYASAWFDVLANAAQRGLARAQSRPLYVELQRLWSADLPALPLYQHVAIDVAPSDLEGVAPTSRADPLSWNAGAWRFRR